MQQAARSHIRLKRNKASVILEPCAQVYFSMPGPRDLPTLLTMGMVLPRMILLEKDAVSLSALHNYTKTTEHSIKHSHGGSKGRHLVNYGPLFSPLLAANISSRAQSA
jgi:hypothetical protein